MKTLTNHQQLAAEAAASERAQKLHIAVATVSRQAVEKVLGVDPLEQRYEQTWADIELFLHLGGKDAGFEPTAG